MQAARAAATAWCAVPTTRARGAVARVRCAAPTASAVMVWSAAAMACVPWCPSLRSRVRRAARLLPKRSCMHLILNKAQALQVLMWSVSMVSDKQAGVMQAEQGGARDW